MIGFGDERKVLVAARPIDFRRGVHGLVAMAAQALNGDLYICVGREYVAARSRSH